MLQRRGILPVITLGDSSYQIMSAECVVLLLGLRCALMQTLDLRTKAGESRLQVGRFAPLDFSLHAHPVSFTHSRRRTRLVKLCV